MSMETIRKSRRTKKGTVISNKMDKTVVVEVENVCRHPQYEKVIKLKKKYYAHHEGQPLNIGDVVIISETRPLSKLKRWRVIGS